MMPLSSRSRAFRGALGAALLSIAASVLSAKNPDVSPRQVIALDTGWRFHLGDEVEAKQPAYNDHEWRLLDLPHDWSVESGIALPPEGDAQGGFFAHGIGWYRKTFTLPATAATQKVVVEFDGVYMNSDVWLNGNFLGRRPYGFIGFRYDITEYLNKNGAPNVLAVRVDDSAEPSTRWYNGSGIYRHVRLITTGYTHFRLEGGLRVTTPEVARERAVVQSDVIIDAHFFTNEEREAWAADAWHMKPVNREVVWRSRILAPDGKEIAAATSVISLESQRAGQRASQWIVVPEPKLWSAETPELYQLRCTLELEGRILDETSTTFGIRQLVFDPVRGLLVNGRPTKLKGVCLHQDAASFGNAVPAGVWAWRLAQLKEMGCNAVRTSHHPFAPEFYDLCDRLGLYVFDEAFDEWTRDWTHNVAENPRGKAKFGYHLYFEQWHETDLRAMLRRDRNHPCVVLYSIGNEIPDQLNDDGWKLAKQLVAICHEEDPTRPATSACDQSFVSSRNGFMDQLDVAGYNYIDRIYPADTYAPEHERFPHRLMLGTETSDRVHNWLGVRDHDYVIGEFIWTGIDYLGESQSLPHRANQSGFLDLAGGRKPAFFQRAAYWRDDPVLQLSVLTGEKPERPTRPPPAAMKWNWPAGATMTVQALTNCDEVELFLDGHSLGKHAISKALYNSDWSVPFAPGRLSAVGYRAGKKVAENELRTTGDAARLELTPLKVPVATDITLVEITLRDAAGLVVSSATPSVKVEVDGPARLIGLDTGDRDFSGSLKSTTRNAWQGRLLATIERTALSGEIRVTATTPGLPPSSARLP